jgi:hypothetical protein
LFCLYFAPQLIWVRSVSYAENNFISPVYFPVGVGLLLDPFIKKLFGPGQAAKLPPPRIRLSARDPELMHARYHQMLDGGKPKIKALVAISRKLLRLIFALARDNTTYIENYDPTHKYKLAA